MTISRLRALGAVSATALVGALFTPVALAEPVAPAPEGSRNVTLFTINDFHGRLASTGQQLACTLETERLEPTYGESLFLSAGDNFGGSEFESMILDENPTIDYLNALDLDASAVGNHEFDQGIDKLQARIDGEDGLSQPQFEYLGANVAGAGLASYSIESRDGNGDGDTEDDEDLQVAVVGAVTQETASLVSPGGIEGITFEDQVAAVEAVIATESDVQTADVVVAAYHDGSANAAEEIGVDPGGSETFERMAATEGADVVFNAHTHVTYAFEQDGTPVMQTGSYGEHLGAVTLNVDAEGNVSHVESQLIDTTSSVEADAEGGVVTDDAGNVNCLDADAASSETFTDAADVVTTAIADAEGPGAEVVGTQVDDVTTAFHPADHPVEYVDGEWAYTGDGNPTKGDRRQEDSALGTEVANSMFWNTRQENFSGAPADLGVINPGGLRADLLHAPTGDEAPGEITYREAANVLPFANSLFTADYTGAQLYTMLEQQWQPEGSSRAFLALGLSDNVSYTYDAAAEIGNRVSSLHLDGELVPRDDSQTFTMVSSSFLVPDGGDNFAVLAEGANATDSGLTDLQAFTDYLDSEVGEELAPDYSARGVEVVSDDDADTVTLRNLDSTALGAPQIREAVVEVDGTEHRTEYVENPGTGVLEATFDYGAWELADGEYPVSLVDTEPATGTQMPLGVLTISGDASGVGGDRDGEHGPKVGLSSETSDDRLL